MKPHTPAPKYRFMLGTTSRVPGAPGWHYLIMDFDNPIPFGKWMNCKNCIQQKTQSGAHVYTSIRMRLKQMLKQALKNGADPTWCRLALKRGWAFLADKSEVKIPWPVERKIIGWRNRDYLNRSYQSTASHQGQPRRRVC